MIEKTHSYTRGKNLPSRGTPDDRHKLVAPKALPKLVVVIKLIKHLCKYNMKPHSKDPSENNHPSLVNCIF